MNAVPDIQPEEQTKALTVVGDVSEAMRSVQTRADIAALLETAQAITTITNADGRQQAHSVLMSLVKVRTSIDSRYDEVSASVRSFMDGLRGEREDLKRLSAAQESRLRTLRDEWDKTIEAEKKARAEAEAKRKAAIQERIDDIRQAPESATGQSSEVIAERIESLKARAIDEAFAEFKGQAEGAKATALVRLVKLHTAAMDHEKEQQRLADERTDLERQKANERRIAAIRARIGSIRAVPNTITARMSSAEIAKIREATRAVVTDESYEELRQEADEVLREAVTTLTTLWEQRKEQEAETERLVTEKAHQQQLTKLRERIDHIRNYSVGARLCSAEDIEKKIAAAKAFIVDKSFGELREEAERVYADTLDALISAQAERKEADAEKQRIAAQKAEQEAATKRIADQTAELERQRQALQVEQETMTAPSDPVEAASTEAVTVAPPAAEVFGACIPTADDIIDLVARTYFVPESTAAEWLANMKFCEATA